MNDNHANMDRNVNMSQNDGGIAQPVWAGDGDGDYSEDSVFSLDFAAIWAAIYRSRFWIAGIRSEEHTSELQSLMRISYAVFCLKKKKKTQPHNNISYYD